MKKLLSYKNLRNANIAMALINFTLLFFPPYYYMTYAILVMNIIGVVVCQKNIGKD